MPPRRLPRLITCALAACALAAPSAASANGAMESTFQDDPLLVYQAPEQVASTLDRLKGMGVDRIRVSVFWKLVAPGPEDGTKPEFDAADPEQYPQGAWDRYDTVLRLATERGIAVNWNLTSPAPNWATGSPERADIDKTYEPNAREFDLFVRAVGTRYSGSYVPPGAPLPLPRVDYWSIWNEPNQPGWLTPQWGPDPRNGKDLIEVAPRLYRELVDAAFDGLTVTGHQQDTILIGETAPKGAPTKRGITRALKPSRFIRQLYCLDDNLQFLKGSSAEARGCPVSETGRSFPLDHPGLFQATGWAHHPYELLLSPSTKQTDPEFLTIANLGDLSKLLKRIYQRYGQAIPGGGRDVPLYLTEFGYQTNPPDPLGVSPAKQAAYLTESEFLAFRNGAVRTLAQFLLVDDKPVPGVSTKSPAAWADSFQTGLVDLDGNPKPAMAAYKLGLFLPAKRIRRGSRLRVWGVVRPAANEGATKVRVEYLRRGSKKGYRPLVTLSTSKVRGYLDRRIKVPGSGSVRLVWTSGDTTLTSRSAGFTVVARKK